MAADYLNNNSTTDLSSLDGGSPSVPKGIQGWMDYTRSGGFLNKPNWKQSIGIN